MSPLLHRELAHLALFYAQKEPCPLRRDALTDEAERNMERAMALEDAASDEWLEETAEMVHEDWMGTRSACG